jgi:hypothetical protein
MDTRHLLALATIARSQHGGLIACWQARQGHVPSSWMEHARRRGLVVPVRRSVGRLAAYAPGCHEAVAAAQLAAGPGAAATRASALQLHPGLPSMAQRVPQIATIGHRALLLDGVETHVTRSLEAADLTVIDGIRTECFGRAVLSTIGDGRVHWTWIARVLDAACRMWGEPALDEVEQAIVRAGARGHRGAATLRLLLDERRGEGPVDRFALQRRWMAVLDAAGLHGEDEHHVTVEGIDRWLDRAWPGSMVCAEVKGHRYHSDRSAFDADAEREAALAAAGWLVVPITSRSDPRSVVRRLRTAIADRAGATPQELPAVCLQ